MSKGKRIDELVRPGLTSFGSARSRTASQTGEKELGMIDTGLIKLNAGENVYGCSPRVNKALSDYPYFHIYPEGMQVKLRQLLAGYAGIGAEHIVAGSGSVELIDLILRLFIEPGDELINCVPTFEMYDFCTVMCNGVVVEVPRDENFAINVNAIKAAISQKTKIVFLANPNSPTGTTIPRQDLLEIIDIGIPVVVDEAYYEFYGETIGPLVNHHKNLMVLRSFSKWAGLAGLRIGYGIFPTEIADYLMRIKHPNNVNSAALVAVRESLKDKDYLLGNVQAIIAERKRLLLRLADLGFLKPVPSSASFVLCSLVKGKASEIQQEIMRRGILIGHFDQPQLRNFLRIGVGKPEHTDVLIKALREIGESIDDFSA